MKINTTLRKIMDKQFRPTLQRIMEKWPEASDVHALVKIAQLLEQEAKDYYVAVKQLTETHGFPLDGFKSVIGEEITDALLQKYGKIRADGQMSIAGANDSDTAAFMRDKGQADKAIRAFNDAHTVFIDTPVEIEVPRLVKVSDKLIRKEVISSYDCYVLEPILDLTGVSDLSKE